MGRGEKGNEGGERRGRKKAGGVLVPSLPVICAPGAHAPPAPP